MVLCAACKNKTSKDRCASKALVGLNLCGRHAKSKTSRLWVDVNNVSDNVIKISKIWRGYHVRNRIKLAGDGCMKRSLCNNSDELISLEPISSIPIFDYFGFEENNKIYGFDIRTAIDCIQRNLIPINPYTRQPFDITTRKRLRQLIGYRIRNKLQNTYENNTLRTTDTILNNRWLQICQICEENGFFNIPHELFLGLNKTQLYIFLSMISNDMKTWAAEHKTATSRRYVYVCWIRNILKKFSTNPSHIEYSFFVSSMLLTILYDSAEPYSICFIIMSSLYRL